MLNGLFFRGEKFNNRLVFYGVRRSKFADLSCFQFQLRVNKSTAAIWRYVTTQKWLLERSPMYKVCKKSWNNFCLLGTAFCSFLVLERWTDHLHPLSCVSSPQIQGRVLCADRNKFNFLNQEETCLSSFCKAFESMPAPDISTWVVDSKWLSMLLPTFVTLIVKTFVLPSLERRFNGPWNFIHQTLRSSLLKGMIF